MLQSDEQTFVSTGRLPAVEEVARLLDRTHSCFVGNSEGACSQVYPALARVPPDLFGMCLVATHGQTHAVGDADHGFAIMSVSKPFVFALVCQQIGPAEARDKLGANATGFAFNSTIPLEIGPDGRTNPMVNSGAIATTSLVRGASMEAKWRSIVAVLSAFAGRDLPVNEEVLASARATNLRNRGLAHLLHSLGRIYCDPMEALDLYTRQCSLDVTARDIAVMGATLADGGVNPITHERVVSPTACRHTLAVMATAGLYETSGDWLYDVGLPGKSGISGGIVTVSPGKGGLGVFSPRLDVAGNSVRGQLATRYLSRRLGIDLFLSQSEVGD